MSRISDRARQHILSLTPYQSARSLAHKDEGAIFLDANECPFEPFIGGTNYNRYPDQQPDEMMQAFGRLFDVSTRNLLVSRGADEAILLLIDVFCEPGRDNLIYCPPTFAMYEASSRLRNVETKQVPLNDDFQMNVDAIINAVDQNTRLVFVCSPNNPTGNLMNRDDIRMLCESLRDKALVVVDETYIEFTDDPGCSEWIEDFDNLCVLRTLSKSFAAAGYRCGVTIAPKDIIDVLRKGLAVYPVPAPVADSVLTTLTPDNIKRLERKRAELMTRQKEVIQKLSEYDEVEHIYPSDCNFILIRVADADQFCATLKSNGIIVRNQSSQPGLENCVRFSIGSEDEMQAFFDVLDGKSRQTGQGRHAHISRTTKETRISLDLDLDRTDPVSISTGIGFYDHMLEQSAKQAGFSRSLECAGDLEVDNHHTIEDCAIALGQGLKKALGQKAGIGRYGFTLPMDESLARVALDLSGRFYLKFEADFPDAQVHDMPVDMVEHVFRSLAENLGANLHIKVEGENTHHMVEACFKAFGRALRQAIRRQGGEADMPSTKGMI